MLPGFQAHFSVTGNIYALDFICYLVCREKKIVWVDFFYFFFYSKKLNSGTLKICFNIGRVEEGLKNIFLPKQMSS